MAAALKECCVSVAIDGVSLLCYVPFTLVFKCVKERLVALAAAAFGAFCGTFTFGVIHKFSFLGIGLVTTTPSTLEDIATFCTQCASVTPRVDVDVAMSGSAAALPALDGSSRHRDLTMPLRQRRHHGWTLSFQEEKPPGPSMFRTRARKGIKQRVFLCR